MYIYIYVYIIQMFLNFVNVFEFCSFYSKIKIKKLFLLISLDIILMRLTQICEKNPVIE